jgi:DnaJ family protein A protein 5
VQKRDPRYREYVATQKQLNEEKQKLQQEQLKQEKLKNQQKLQDYQVPEWAQTTEADEIEQERVEMEWLDNDNDGYSNPMEGGEDFGDDELYCIVCDKLFQSLAQMNNHKKSKKHLKLMEDLKREMMDQEEILSSNLDSVHLSDISTPQVLSIPSSPKAEQKG